MGGRSRPVGLSSRRAVAIVALAALIGFAALAVSMSKRGDAAFPGANGRIAYSYGDAYSTAIWSANADGGSPTMLGPGSGFYEPSYSPDGGRIAMAKEGGVYVMNANGSGLTQLASSVGSTDSDVEWEEDYDDPYSAKTIPVVKITSYREKWRSFFSPAFSPDGSRLAVSESHGDAVYTTICAVAAPEDQDCFDYGEEGSYFNYEGGCQECGSHLVTLNSGNGAYGGELTPTSPSVEDYDPTYSAGGKLAFTRWAGITPPAIWVSSGSGVAPVEIAHGQEPDFSPDGTKIVFARFDGTLGVIAASGGPVGIVSPPLQPGASTQSVRSPAFSPDGSRIVFELAAYSSSKPIARALFTIGADGSSPAKVADGATGPTWQAVAPPPPPPPPAVKAKAKPAKGKVKLDKKHEATIGTIVCGSSTCTLKLLSAKLKVGKKKYATGVKVPKTLAAGKQAKAKAKVGGKGLKALLKKGKGKLSAKIQVVDASGKLTLTLTATLLAPKKHPKRKHKH